MTIFFLYLFIFAVFCGGIAVVFKSRTAACLLAGHAAQLALDLCGVPFIPPLWIFVDLGVIAVMLHRNMTMTDCWVLTLFAPSWFFDFIPGNLGYDGSALVCSTQLFLTFPVKRIWRGLRKRISIGHHNNHMLFVGGLG